MNLVTLPTIEFPHDSKGASAITYGKLLWHVIPIWWPLPDGSCACGNTDCKNIAKHPITKLAPFGQKSATTDIGTIKRWWSAMPEANIGIYLLPSNLCAIDIDPRNGGLETIEMLEARHGQIVSDLLQYTGGGGEHRVFERPSAGTLPGKLGPGVDVKLDGYIVAEPSTHKSGGMYAWEASSSPLDGCVATPLPDWLRDLAAPKQITSDMPVGDRLPIDQARIDELRAALPSIANPDRDTWLIVGFAIHNDIGGQEGFTLWDHWSTTNGSTYDPVDQIRVWRSFKRKGIDGVTLATVFKLAMDAGWNNEKQPEETPENVRLYIENLIKQARKEPEVKPHPGEWRIPVKALQDVADWFSTLSEEPHPVISMVGALALGSVVTGRRYRSINANWTAMHFVLLAPSGVGKNYIKSGINRLLHAAGLADFFGASFYTHSSAIYWALHHAPTHICVTDEFGDSFAEARRSDSSNKLTVFKALKQVYSDVDDTFRTDAYSMAGLSKKDREDKKTPPIVKPSLTLLGLATPGQFYQEIKGSHIEGGMMNRFVVFNVDRNGLQIDRQMGDGNPPESIIEEIKIVRRMDGINGRDQEFDMMPVTVNVKLNSGAVNVFAHFKNETRAKSLALEDVGMGNMPMRWRENAMRLATMLAAWENHNEPVITQDLAEWSCRLVRHCGEETIRQLSGRVAETDYQQSLNAVLMTIKAAGQGVWVKRSELLRIHRGIKSREMGEVISHLIEAGMVISQVSSAGVVGGRPTQMVMYVPEETVSS